jgi:hypothetical protein
MATRSYAQQGRKFLSTAFQLDAYDRSETLPKRPPVYECQASNQLTGTAEREVHAFQFAVWRSLKPNVFRLPLRQERDDLEAAPFSFMAEAADELVVEALTLREDGTEQCLAVASLPLAKAKGVTDLHFRRGTAAVRYIGQACAPERGANVLTLSIDVRVLTSESLAAHPCDFYLPFTCIPRTVFDPRSVLCKFKVKVTSLTLNLPRDGAVTGKYETRLLLHNQHRELDVRERLGDLQSKGSAAVPVLAWDSKVQFDFPSVPLLPSSHLLVMLFHTRRGETFRTPIGVAVIPLVSADICDRNVQLTNVPLLKGPYSSTAAERCLPPSDGKWFAPVAGITFAATLEYFDTPNRAPRRQIDAPATSKPKKLVPKPASPAPLAEVVSRSEEEQPKVPSPSAEAIVPAPGPAAETKVVKEASPVESRERLVTHSTTTVVERIQIPPELEAMNKEVYALLKSLADEVQHIRRTIETPGAANAAEVVGLAKAETERIADEEGVEVLELDRRGASLSFDVRQKISAGTQSFTHPLTSAAMSQSSLLSPKPLSSTALAVRFEGVTVPRGSNSTPFPSQLNIQLSFGGSDVTVGPIALSLCGEDPRLGQTFALRPAESTSSLIWSEQVRGLDRDALSLLTPYKSGQGHLYAQLFDDESGFYAGTVAIPFNSFDRAPHARSYELPLDIPLQWDTTAAAAGCGGPGSMMPRDNSPLLTEIGIVHLTTCAIGFDAPAVHADANNCNGGAVRRVVEVKRLPGSAFADDLATQPPPQPADTSADGHAVLRNLPPDQRNLHEQRAMHLKRALQNGPSKKPLVTAPATGSTGGADRIEMDLRMKLVERKREELKATRIAEHLRSRITRSVSVTVARGVPRTVRCPFVNPYATSMAFSLRFPSSSAEPSQPRLRAHSASGPTLELGARQEAPITFIAEHDSAATGAAGVRECHVTNDRGELVMIIHVSLTLTGPIISRRHTVFGDGGSVQTRTLYFRAFSGATLGVERTTVDELLEATVKVASWPHTTSTGLRAESMVNVDPIARGYATVWETVTLECRIPSAEDGEEALVHFYATSAAEKHIETWAVKLVPCMTMSCDAVHIGQTTAKIIPVESDRCYAFSGTAVATPQVVDGAPCTRVALKPVVDGKQSVLLHAKSGSKLQRVVLNFVATLPEPTHHVALKVRAEEAAIPIHRRIPVDNSATRPMTFRLSTTYREHAVLSHTVIANMQPGERKYVTLSLRGLGAGARYPIFVFINDDADKTLESHLVDVAVEGYSSSCSESQH